MNPKQINSSAIAILVTALVVLGVGAYTGNGGFQLAGALFLLVGMLLASHQAHERGGPD